MTDTFDFSREVADQALAACGEIYTATLGITELLQLPREPLSTFRLSLQATILELGNATLRCLHGGVLSASEILLRSMLEAYVDLLAATLDSQHVMHCELKHHREWKKVLTAAASKTNDFLADISELPDLDQLIERRQHQIASLEAMGAKELTVEQRFKSADAYELYDGLFRRLSACSHNNFGELLRRHVHVRSDNKVDLTMFRSAEPHETYLIADTLSGILLGSTLQFKDYLSNEQLKALEKLKTARLKIGLKV